MRVRREVRWILWALWGGCLLFCVWFLAEAVALFRQAESW